MGAPGRSPGSSPSRPPGPGRRCGGRSRGTCGRSDVGGVDGQPVVLCALRLPRQHAVVAVLLPHRLQHGVPDDARAARGALLEDVVVLLPVRPQGLLPHEDEDLHPPGVAELEGLDVVEVHGAVRRQAREVHPRVGQSGLPARGARSSAALYCAFVPWVLAVISLGSLRLNLVRFSDGWCFCCILKLNLKVT